MADPAPVLREPANLVSSRAPYIWAVGAAVRSLVLGAAVTGALIAWGDGVDWILLALYGVLAVAYCILMPVYRFKVHRWESTETAVYTQAGWLSRERRIAPMSRVQTVDLQQTAVSRLFGLANVTVTTASAAGPLRIEALDAPVAERLVDELTRRSEDEAGDAT